MLSNRVTKRDKNLGGLKSAPRNPSGLPPPPPELWSGTSPSSKVKRGYFRRKNNLEEPYWTKEAVWPP